jgi:hypothetical protein
MPAVSPTALGPVYDFAWDAMHPDSPYARIEASTMLAFKRR